MRRFRMMNPGADRGDFFADHSPLPKLVGDAIDGERRYEWLQSALTVLSERELRILRERRLSDEGETLEALGTKLGIPKSACVRSKIAPGKAQEGVDRAEPALVSRQWLSRVTYARFSTGRAWSGADHLVGRARLQHIVGPSPLIT